jgi:hypothetical protein
VTTPEGTRYRDNEHRRLGSATDDASRLRIPRRSGLTVVISDIRVATLISLSCVGGLTRDTRSPMRVQRV